MHWKRIVVAVAVACMAFPASGNWNRAYAVAAYVGENDGCYILGSPSNDFFCSQWDEYDMSTGGDGGGGGGGGGGGDSYGRECGRGTFQLCGGTNTRKTFTKTCIEWRVTAANGTVALTIWKPTSLALGFSSECATWVEVTTEITTPNRWTA